jgi:hypothetical protein
MAKIARITTRVTAVAAALAAGIALAPAASAQSSKDNLNLDGLFTDQIVTGTLILDGTASKLVNLQSVTQVVDELGRAIGSPRNVALRSGTGNGKLADYACLPKTKGNKKFTQFAPAEAFVADSKGKFQALFHTYRQKDARTVSMGGRPYMSTQFEICGVGGADTENGSRLRRAGVGIAYADPIHTYKIGQAWKEGSTPANYTLNMAFKAEVRKGVEIGGGISQTPTNKLTGSISTPFKTDVDVFARNAVNAWWQDSCVGAWYGCRHIHGSKDFHGAVAHALYEFSPAQAKAVQLGGFRLHAFRSAS